MQPSPHHTPPRCRTAVPVVFLGSRSGWGQAGCPIPHGGGSEEPNYAPHISKLLKDAPRMPQGAAPGGQVPLLGDGIGQRELGFMVNIGLTPRKLPQVPTEGAQHPKVPPARSPRGYFGLPMLCWKRPLEQEAMEGKPADLQGFGRASGTRLSRKHPD